MSVTFHDLDRVDVEHLLGIATGKGLVKLRVTLSDGTLIGLGEIDPAAARQLAADLTTCAARAEYEQDLATEVKRAGFPDDVLGAMLVMVRLGEAARHGQTPGEPA